MDITAESWLLGAQLRVLREAKELTALEVAERYLQCSQSRVYMVEGGTRVLNSLELKGLVEDAYGRPDLLPKLEELRKTIAENIRRPIKDHITGHPDAMMFHQLQLRAQRVLEVGVELVPGLCQSEEYSKEMQRRAGRNEEEIEKYTQSRMENQERVLSLDHPPRIDFIITESTIQRAAYTPGQVEKLIDRASHPSITVRVIPNSVGVHLFNTSFTVLQFDELPSVLFHDLVTGGSLVTDIGDVKHALDQLEMAERITLSAEGSLDIFRQYAEYA